MASTTNPFISSLHHFCTQLSAAYASVPGVQAQPEAQLTGPVSDLLKSYPNIQVRPEVALSGVGRPDLGVLSAGLLTGYVELKPPGKGANPTKFNTPHDRQQWAKFKNLPNLLYTDGREWGLYRNGEPIGKLIRLTGDPTTEGAAAITAPVAAALEILLYNFLTWQPIVPGQPKDLANVLAPLCRLLRDEVQSALTIDSTSALGNLHDEWKRYFFPDATIEQFADAYAQTLTYALLLAHVSGAPSLSPTVAADSLLKGHGLLSETLSVLSHRSAYEQVAVPLNLLRRTIEAVDPVLFTGASGTDPWLYFYEDFLGAYDPAMRKKRGVYYTPIEVVQTQVRLVDELLRTRLNAPDGFVDKSVATLDPACGTGTYLLAALQHGLDRVAHTYGPGAKAPAATIAARQLHAFELLVGPYAVAHLRLTQQLIAAGGTLPANGINVLLADTLEAPYAAPPSNLPLTYKTLSREHERAQHLKKSVPVLVCIGNPPYFREQHDPNVPVPAHERHGGWIRFGDGPDKPTLLDDFLRPLTAIGAGVHAKNLYNDYVYFWRWALWKTFEQPPHQSGIVSFITASSYLHGPGFAGMRQVMRETFEELWIIDLEGDNLGTRKTDNVFAIQTPVCIAIGLRTATKIPGQSATVRYTRLVGTEAAKLARLGAINQFADLPWQVCPTAPTDPLLPAATTVYTTWPLLTDLFPWQANGTMTGRTWVTAESTTVLERRWQVMVAANNRTALFKDSPSGRKVHDVVTRTLPNLTGSRTAITKVSAGTTAPPISPYAFRSFDRQWIFADNRLIDRPSPTLWESHGPQQIYLTSLLTGVMGNGPATVATEVIPDKHHFCNRGGNDVIPLYRNAAGTQPNITAGVLSMLADTYGCAVEAPDLMAYVYGLMASPAYVEQFWLELETPGPRIPLTQDGDLFKTVADLGRELLWLHTAGNRMVPPGHAPGTLPSGRAKIQVSAQSDEYPESFKYDADTETLHVGTTGQFGPVSAAVWAFSVSGLHVIDSWLGYRMQKRSGKSSSDLDTIRPDVWSFDTELIRLLWMLEATLDRMPRATDLLRQVVDSPLFVATQLPSPKPAEFKGPEAVITGGLFDD